MEQGAWLIGLGLVVGALGTLIGAGGGFVLMPVLLLLFPQERPATITSVSLAVVFFNALSGSWAYARMKRIDLRSGLLFAAAAIPGAIVGALTTSLIPRRQFDAVFGVLLLGAAGFLLIQKDGAQAPHAVSGGPRIARRRLVEANGTVHVFAYDRRLGLWLSALVGYLSSLLGIGGGIVHVPALVRLLNFPVHIATATSHFILAIMALTGTLIHVAAGSFSRDGVWETLYLAIGVVLGAQVGAAVSVRVRGTWIIRGLAIALALVGMRILWMAIRA